MERTQVVVPAGEIERQRDFIRKTAQELARRGHPPLAVVDTYGCQQNVADSQRLMGMLRDMGCAFTQDPDAADVIVINTCAIRDNAEKKVFGVVGQLVHAKERNPELMICLCGCMAQQESVAKKIKASYRHVDLVFGPQALWKFPELLFQVLESRKRVFSIENVHGSIAEGLPVVRESGVKAWVSIMYGCNNFCSYCIVPYVRGRERSREPEDILAEVRQLAAEGYREITLLGQNVNSYGKDLERSMDFADLLAEIDKIPGDYLIRFMTSHPKDAGEKLFDTMAGMPGASCRSWRSPAILSSASPARRKRRLWTPFPSLKRCGMTPCLPLSTPPGPAHRRRRCRTRPAGRKNRCGLTGCWRRRTGFPASCTGLTWAGLCGYWWTASAETSAGPSPAAPTADVWCIWTAAGI